MNKIMFAIALLACAATAQATHGGLHGIRDSTGVTNEGSGTLSWENSGNWTRCNAASQGCGNSTGYQTQVVNCRGDWLDGTVSTVEEHLCLHVVSEIGPKPRASRTCTINWGRCVPPPPPPPPRTPTASAYGTNDCRHTPGLCQAYVDTFGRPPEAGEGPEFWNQYSEDTGNKPGSAKFQVAFEDGAQGSDCYKLGRNKSPHCLRR